jgi:hypothetical protein
MIQAWNIRKTALENQETLSSRKAFRCSMISTELEEIGNGERYTEDFRPGKTPATLQPKEIEYSAHPKPYFACPTIGHVRHPGTRTPCSCHAATDQKFDPVLV